MKDNNQCFRITSPLFSTTSYCTCERVAQLLGRQCGQDTAFIARFAHYHNEGLHSRPCFYSHAKDGSSGFRLW